jgi:DNA-binding CsgD family transcriptional regulator
MTVPRKGSACVDGSRAFRNPIRHLSRNNRWISGAFPGVFFAGALGEQVGQSNDIDEIYEAAIVPELWMRTLDRMAEIGGGQGTLLFAAAQKSSQFICSASIREFVQRWSSEGWIAIDERGKRLIPIPEPRFLTDLDAFTIEELDDIPIYRDFFRKSGMGWCAGTTIRTPASDTIVFSVERQFKKGPVEPEAVKLLDGLRPHLARAATLSAKVGLERAGSSVTALQAVGLPAAVLSGTGKALAANALLADLVPEITIGAGDRLSFRNSSIQSLYARYLKSEAHGGSEVSGHSLALPAAGVNPPAVVHLLPLRGMGRDIFSGASVLLYVTMLSRRSALPIALLQSLFDLTPAEARVAKLIGSGRTVTEAADELAVQVNTVRTQLKSIFAKTGTRRQADLVSMVTIAGGQK